VWRAVQGSPWEDNDCHPGWTMQKNNSCFTINEPPVKPGGIAHRQAGGLFKSTSNLYQEQSNNLVLDS
jgi:hypothetical protein